jgi:hypothetical protein
MPPERRSIHDATPGKCPGCGAYKAQVQLGRWDYDHFPSCADYRPPEPPADAGPARYCRLCDTHASDADVAVQHEARCPRHPRNLGRQDGFREPDPPKPPQTRRPGSSLGVML